MLFPLDQAERRDRVALIESATNRSWTYGQLADEVARLAAMLKRPQRELVFAFCRNDLQSVAWYLAAIEAGHAVALLNDRLNEDLKVALIKRYRPEWVFAASGAVTAKSPSHGGVVHDELSLLLSTSGSTGSPKFVRLSKSAIAANAESIRQALRIAADHRPVAHLPIHYSYGLSVLNSHLLAGAAILLTDAALMTPEFWNAMQQHAVDSFSGVPYTYQMLRRLGLDKAPALRILTQAGGKLDEASIAHFHRLISERGGTFWAMYGQTEATARITILDAADLPAKLGSAGRAIPGGRLQIETDAGELTAVAGVEGELVYEGPNVMLGYAEERAHLAKGDELGGVLRTGDRAVLDGEGYVRILGRAKRDAKLFGLRVNLDELEAFVRPHGPAAAVAGGKGVVIFCEFGDEAQFAQVADALAAKLNIHRSAFEFRRIEKLPVKDSGKIAYDELRGLL